MLRKEVLLASTARRLAYSALELGLKGSVRSLASAPGVSLTFCQPPGVKMSDRRELSTSYRSKFRLTLDTINPYVKDMEYAVRGKMPMEAAKIEAAIKKVRISSHQKGQSWLR